MKSKLTALLLYAITITALAKAGAYIPTQQQILAELSQRSGLSIDNLQNLLADCDADQQSMYFCAYSDEVVADLKLQHTLSLKQQQLPHCQTKLLDQVESWENKRDSSCAQSAAKEWGDGSMKPTAELVCSTAETNRFEKQLEKMANCPRG
jgi:uncharacterized protein YecT (DUF1311 family)